MHNPHVTLRHRETQESRQNRAQVHNQAVRHGTPSGDHVLMNIRSTAASTEIKEAKSRNRSWTAPTHYAPHRANSGNTLNLLRKKCTDAHVVTFSRVEEYNQKLETIRKKSKRSRKHGIVARNSNHTTKSHHIPPPDQERKKRSID